MTFLGYGHLGLRSKTPFAKLQNYRNALHGPTLAATKAWSFSFPAPAVKKEISLISSLKLTPYPGELLDSSENGLCRRA